MNWVDLTIGLFVLAFAIEGQRRGFLVQVFDVLGFFTSLVVSLTFYSQAAQFLIDRFNMPQIAANPIGFLLLWLTTETIFFSVLSGRFKKIFQDNAHRPVNKFFDFIPAAANALLFLSFALLFVVSLPISGSIKKDIFASKAGSQLVDKATVLERPFNDIFGPITKRGLTFFTIGEDQRECQTPGFSQNQTTLDTQSEQKMLELVNTERTKAGVQALVWSQDLAQIGRNHSKDMLGRNYFCHYSPEGKDIGDRLDDIDFGFRLAGENLAFAPDVSRAHSGLIASPGHKRNILDPAFSKVGIGAIDGGIYGKMFTQVFTD